MTAHWGEKRYYSLDYYLKKTYGEKLYKILPPVVLCLSQSRLKPGSSSLQKNIPDHLTLLIFRHIPTLMLL